MAEEIKKEETVEEPEQKEESEKDDGYWRIKKPNPRKVLKGLAKGLGIAAGGALAGAILSGALGKGDADESANTVAAPASEEELPE